MRAIRTVLIANRGEIAVRCIRACRKLGIDTVAIYTAADSGSLHVSQATRSVLLDDDGPGAFANVYDFLEKLLEICKAESIDAVFAGYGFLSENAEFARQVEEHDIAFVGPDYRSIEAMGLKHTARELAVAANVPVVKGSGLLRNPDEAVEAARVAGLPVMLKASGGGGGMGTQVCWTEDEVVEECPSPHLADKPELRQRLLDCAISLTRSINYRSAGTVEFLVDDESDDFFFLEMNTRLQVEHGISELCYDVDIVELMLKQADYEFAKAGGIPSDVLLELQKDTPNGAAIEVRICCENPASQFLPSSGLVQQLRWPAEDTARVDTWIQAGTQVSSDFDSLLAKVMVRKDTRDSAIRHLADVLQYTQIGGIVNNLSFLRDLITSQPFRSGRTLTTFLSEQYKFEPCGIQVIAPGGHTTIQQARIRSINGFGIPKGGPMDDLSATLANLIVGNEKDTECLEVIMMGPELIFLSDAIISICGAELPVEIDGKTVDMWTRVHVRPGQKLKLGIVRGHGASCYIAFKGGLPSAADWLGSKSTTPSLGLGGLQCTKGRILRHGDYLELAKINFDADRGTATLPLELRPPLNVTEIYVMHGPHDSDEFITHKGRDQLSSTTWKVNHNCSRTGIRLDGPSIEWARETGGAAGAHPSNVVDYPYPSPGGVNWTGDSPAIFPRDAPDLGGFLCSSTVPSAELWKLGQLKPGHAFRFLPVSFSAARKLSKLKSAFIDAVRSFLSNEKVESVRWNLDKEEDTKSSIIKVVTGDTHTSTLTIRQAGDTGVLVDLGFQNATLETSVKANSLASAIQATSTSGLSVRINISSVLVEFDPELFSQEFIVDLVAASSLSVARMEKPMKCRLLKLPIVFDHPAIKESEERYTKLIRSKAAYLPDGVAYVQENNALPKREDVFHILRNSRFMVVAVGFMIGLPLMLPLDPRARLSAQKYNPPRTSTPPGTVGLGGRSFCIYPTDQPGGYVPIARSIPVWDTFSLRKGFAEGRPWLCEPFDLVEFYDVNLEEFSRIEKAFQSGTWEPSIENAVFDGALELVKEAEIEASPEGKEFVKKQEIAADAMGCREQQLYAEWKAETSTDDEVSGPVELQVGGLEVISPHQGKVWKSLVKAGDKVSAGQTVAILESMKMEIPIVAGSKHDGFLVKVIAAKEGALVYPGDVIVVLAN
ncbi:putative urea carboxylase [Colletotrichum sidae]|uniref:Putative urea carboxylase n=1 Tax=Colletotrichum sidae TaxID=1347389 RepID=A0A4R8T726_9PEZI|nr:putative urea carboxylase [Colletotrichum sidae]